MLIFGISLSSIVESCRPLFQTRMITLSPSPEAEIEREIQLYLLTEADNAAMARNMIRERSLRILFELSRKRDNEQE